MCLHDIGLLKSYKQHGIKVALGKDVFIYR